MKTSKILLVFMNTGEIFSKNPTQTSQVSSIMGKPWMFVDFVNAQCSHSAKSTQFIAGECFYTSGENVTVSTWNRMITYFQRVNFSSFDGIIVVHGVDTISYTSSLFALLLAGIKIPVIFVQSDRYCARECLNIDESSVFYSAVKCIEYGISPAVYVAYQASKNQHIFLCNAARFKQRDSSLGNTDTTELLLSTVSALPLQPICETPLPLPLLHSLSNSEILDCVLKIHPYVGIRYDAYRLDRFRAVLHGTYHSSACLEYQDNDSVESILPLLKCCEEAGINLYLSPAWYSHNIHNSPRYLRNEKLHLLVGMTDEMAYCKLLLFYSSVTLQRDWPEFITCNFCGENSCYRLI